MVKKINFKICLSILILAVLCCFTNVIAEEFPEPKYPLENIEPKEFIVKNVYSYWLMTYKQPLVVEALPKENIKFDTPEDAFAALISAMKLRDHNLYTACWDKASGDEYISKFNDQDTLRKYIDGWESVFVGSIVNLTKRVNRKGFVVVEFVVVKGGVTTVPGGTMKFVLENNEWKATNLFQNDPIANYLYTGKDSIEIPADLF